MEILRQAIRNLETQAEKFERHLGAERFPAPSEQFFQDLTDTVNGVAADLAIPEPKAVAPEEEGSAT